MFYTLSKGLLWYLLALLLGFVIGYLVRSVMCNRQISRAKADRSDDAELERLRGRVANLEPVVAERDRLRDELEACRKQSGLGGAASVAGAVGGNLDAPKVGGLDAPSLGGVDVDASADLDAPRVAGGDVDASADLDASVDAAVDADAAVDVDPSVDVDASAGIDPSVDVSAGDVSADLDAPQASVDLDAAAGDASADLDAPNADVDAFNADVAASVEAEQPAIQGFASSETDVSGAADVLGRKIKADDLTVVEGIGPAISKLCNGIGIHTWAELATTETSLLETMLRDAGPRFQMHDPGTWPEQASLLAAGRWEDFKRLTDELDGGRRI